MSVKQSTRFCRAHLCQSATCDQAACLFVCPSHASIMSKLITVGSFGFTQRPANRKFPFESNRIGGYDQNSNRISNLIGGQSFTASKFNVNFLLIVIGVLLLCRRQRYCAIATIGYQQQCACSNYNFGTRKCTLQHVYQCTEVQNNGGQQTRQYFNASGP